MDNDWNSGHRNSGHMNSGDGNSGDGNSGDGNSGHGNSGHGNSGHGNSSHRNSGDWNSGDGNSGHGNSGDWNSGDMNSGSRNSGLFNTDEPCARFFNKPTDIKLSDFYDSDQCPSWFGFELNQWISAIDMTDEEKKENTSWETCRGYLRTHEYKEAWANFWAKTSEENKHKFLNLPNFDAEIFHDITGIDVRKEQSLSGKKVSVELDGKKYTATID